MQLTRDHKSHYITIYFEACKKFPLSRIVRKNGLKCFACFFLIFVVYQDSLCLYSLLAKNTDNQQRSIWYCGFILKRLRNKLKNRPFTFVFFLFARDFFFLHFFDLFSKSLTFLIYCYYITVLICY